MKNNKKWLKFLNEIGKSSFGFGFAIKLSDGNDKLLAILAIGFILLLMYEKSKDLEIKIEKKHIIESLKETPVYFFGTMYLSFIAIGLI